uniref:Uncharacterized protein n=1 Tax=Paramormyrops kingsleyae TaxID=1676925 RepID=A0A3B3SLQ1_9TELE
MGFMGQDLQGFRDDPPPHMPPSLRQPRSADMCSSCRQRPGRRSIAERPGCSPAAAAHPLGVGQRGATAPPLEAGCAAPCRPVDVSQYACFAVLVSSCIHLMSSSTVEVPFQY